MMIMVGVFHALPYYPIWSLLIIALDVFVIWEPGAGNVQWPGHRLMKISGRLLGKLRYPTLPDCFRADLLSRSRSRPQHQGGALWCRPR
jgi:hypothetical protein